MTRVFLIATIFFCIFLALHWLIFYFVNPEEKVKSLLFTYSACLIAGIGIFYRSKLFLDVDKRFRNSYRVIYKIFSSFFYAAFFTLLFIGYLEFYFTVDRSITFRILTIIEASENKAMKSQDVLALYNTDNVIISRFDDLEYGGYLSKRPDSTYGLTAKGSLVEKIYRYSMKLLRFEQEEYIKKDIN